MDISSIIDGVNGTEGVGDVSESGLIGKFVNRTVNHINAVRANALRLDQAALFPGIYETTEKHDLSKLSDPEMIPYVWITESYRCKAEGEPFEFPPGMKEKGDEATIHHIKNNRHHPEFHDDSWDGQLGSNRDAPDGSMVDATAMPDEDIAEMICDWFAVAQERGTSVREWADNNINIRWMFLPRQEELINDLISFFEAKK